MGWCHLTQPRVSKRFKYWFRARVHESVNAAQPVVVGDRVIITAAYRVGAAELKVNPDGKSFEVAWRNPTNMLAHWSTPIAHDGVFLRFSGRHENEGIFRCLELGTGKMLWNPPVSRRNSWRTCDPARVTAMSSTRPPTSRPLAVLWPGLEDHGGWKVHRPGRTRRMLSLVSVDKCEVRRGLPLPGRGNEIPQLDRPGPVSRAVVSAV
jgi:hypothetical protein